MSQETVEKANCKMVPLTCAECSVSFQVKFARRNTAKYCTRRCKAIASVRQGKSCCLSGNKLRLGLKPVNAFPKGNVPWNLGLSVRVSPATEFKAGSVPVNRVEVGTVRIRGDKLGALRAWVKVGEPARWKPRAVLVWEEANGPLEHGLLVHHDDRDTLNDRIDNLIAMTRAEHINEHRGELQAAKGF